MATGENERLAGRYRVIEQLGRGGMGVVWRAVDEVLGREVAVKELRAYNDASAPELADLRVRMQREARAAARVRHPGVVAVHDVADHEGRPVIVMELVDGPSLDAVLTEKGLLDPREAAALGARVLEALGAAHRVGVLHRDVKPGNILLDGSGRIVLTDFGIAAMDDPGDGSTTRLTRSGELVGSLDYLAPERAQGQEPGPASDIWALGATLYTAVEGGSPFRRTSTWSTLTAIVVDPLPEPVRSGPLGPVLQRLMSKDPAQRPDAAEAARLLTAVAEGNPAGPAPRPAHRATGAHAQQPQGAFGPAVPPAAAAGTPAAAPYAQPAPGFGPHTPPAPGDFGTGPGGYGTSGGYGTGANPAAHPSYATGPTHPAEQGGHPTGPTPSAGPQDPASLAASAVAAPGGGGRRGRAAPADTASGGRRKALVASGVAAVLLAGAGVTYALGDGSNAERTAGGPAAKSSQAADAPDPDGLPAIGSLPTDAAQKTAAPTPPGKDKGKQADRKTPTATPGGTKPGSPSSGTDAAGGVGGKGAKTSDNGSAGAGSAGGAAGSGGRGTAAGGSVAGGAAAGGGNPPPQPPPAAPVCHGIGAGKYNCDVWRTSDSIRANGDRAGTLNAGTNYFYCQADLGRRVTYGNWTNVWWARTDDDNGNTGVYVSVVYLKGGDNDRPLPGLPTC
ncbi:serine/threonine-protein kinase [Streptomyces candidus]|uniref:non-specific serine/threonine protein kinase n=1 Tax=Streptomyces candidus TaxID=67283 RepID=A0A7X0HHU8_9ACTN|nr:serine/threonine-protein kinase [Streptomyces candidus]MBB6437855.1 tRNA A-37 threonylcarbamoyl transferase component Bud32 [Streptomyces candidus]